MLGVLSRDMLGGRADESDPSEVRAEGELSEVRTEERAGVAVGSVVESPVEGAPCAEAEVNEGAVASSPGVDVKMRFSLSIENRRFVGQRAAGVGDAD